MDVDWAVTGGGSITINAAGSLMQVGDRALLVDGSGSQFINNGTTSFNNVAFTNSAQGTNSGVFSIDQGLYFGVNTTYTNSGVLNGVDSLLTEGTYTNSGTTYSGNFLNTGTYTNSGVVTADSVGNTGIFNSTGGYMYFTAFGNSGTFSMSNTGFMDVSANWFNIGDFTLDAGISIYAHNDFYNGDTLGGTAFLHNYGMIEVSNDFYNGYTMDGSGKFCVANDSYNGGTINGTLDFCDNTGTDFDLNLGTIAVTVTFCVPGCAVGMDESELVLVRIAPNPSNGIITVESTQNLDKYSVYSVMGQRIETGELLNNTIDLSHLNSGTYLIRFEGETTSQLTRIIIQ